jgi:hypothetical protein
MGILVSASQGSSSFGLVCLRRRCFFVGWVFFSYLQIFALFSLHSSRLWSVSPILFIISSPERVSFINERRRRLESELGGEDAARGWN